MGHGAVNLKSIITENVARKQTLIAPLLLHQYFLSDNFWCSTKVRILFSNGSRHQSRMVGGHGAWSSLPRSYCHGECDQKTNSASPFLSPKHSPSDVSGCPRNTCSPSRT